MAYADYVGRREEREDCMDPRLVEGLAATLGRPLPEGDLPPLWHWTLFQDWRPSEGLGPDGHPRRGGFLPPVDDLPRRMWAGGRVRFEGGLRVGDRVRRVSTIRSVDEKNGSTGRLMFVTVEHVLDGPRGRVLSEEQDIVYRDVEGAAVKPAKPAPEPPAGTSRATVLPDAVTLFRYSALTGNGHRIHYDHPYATGVEGYPGLIVHGPLQATWLAAHALDAVGARARLASFRYRGRRPCFADRAVTLLAERRDGAVRLETRDETGATCQEADATLA